MGKLETYLELKSKMDAKASENKLPLNGVLALQELNYRIDVLGTLKTLCNTAPITEDKHALCFHFELTQKYIENLIAERKIGVKANDELAKKRATAEENLKKVVNSGVKKFKFYRPTSDDKYKKDVSEYIVNVLTVWFPFRDQYVSINL